MRKWLLTLSIVSNLLLLGGGLWAVKKMGGWKYLAYRMKHDGVSGVYEQRKNLLDKLPVKEGTIIFLGNSLTAYGDWAELFQNPNILNRGIPGDGTQGVLDRIESITNHKPSKIFLMIGINDLMFIPVNQILGNYEKIIRNIQSHSPQTRIYVQSILPVNSNIREIPIDNRDVRLLNEEIRSIAEKYAVRFVDLFDRFADEAGDLKPAYSLDGIHLDASGYFLWKDAIEPLVQE